MQPRNLTTDDLQLLYYVGEDHVQLTADTVVRLDKIPAGRRVRIDSVSYYNQTGLALDPTNAMSLKLLKNSNLSGVGTLISAVFNTDTDDVPAGVALVADAWVTATLTATDADRVLAPGDTLDLFFDEDGAVTLPPGRIVIRGRYV
jgi:hypothetical protein